MGNGIGKVCLCSAAAGDISRRHNTNLLGDSIFYVRPPDPFYDGDVTTFRSVSGASVSANSSTTPSATIADSLLLHSSVVSDSSASSTSSMPLQQSHAWWSGPVERGFSSGPVLNEKDSSEPSKNLKRSFSHNGCRFGNEPRNKNQNLKGILTRVIPGFVAKGVVSMLKKKKENAVANATPNGGLSLQSDHADIDNNCYLDNGGDLVLMGSENLQWAQGRAGEDRVHIVISEEQGWVFVGIYDGFNGPDATDYLLDNLFYAVYDELKGLLCGHKLEEKVLGLANGCCDCEIYPMENDDVLLALSVALKKTEDAFLKNVDDNPVLAMMGSCVLVMLMKGEDVYLMNVGDSRAVLATHDQSANSSIQLTMEHSTLVKEEVQRIKKEHPDDPSAITKGRVKGYLNVTRAFGAGFLKQPKQNNAILETFRVNYIGDSPYITCSPSLHHHRLSLSDRFLILCSDGLHQYFTNEEAVSIVESFITLSPDIDPAQLLIKEALCRAAKRAGIDFRELLEIPQGERRLYHDDISIVIISFEGKIWRSSV